MAPLPKQLSPLGRRVLTACLLAALWLPSLDAVLHGALSAHQWQRHAESAEGCHAERCTLGMALALQAIVPTPVAPLTTRLVTEATEPALPRQAPLPVRPRPSSLPRSPPA